MVHASRSYCFIVLSSVGLLGVGCQSSPDGLTTRTTQVHTLLELGKPCALETQCASGFCVDGVCCDTACGGGVRDLLSCSDIYGAVAGLVNGTCTTLSPGDACGALVSVNPCTWRGSTVNSGGNCPNPPGDSVACFACVDDGDCDGAFPVCLDGACVVCDGDHDSGSTAACPEGAPVCSEGQCGGCSGCEGTTPACDGPTNTCAPCNGDYNSGATLSCPSSSAPACLADGSCGECSATNTTRCTDSTPTCDVNSNECTGCTGDYRNNGESGRCPTADNPVCFGDNTCGRCASDDDCNTSDTGPKCNVGLGNCGPACDDSTPCGDGHWCSSGVCTPKVPNGGALPNITPIGGVCTPDNAEAVCLSGACDTNDHSCGIPNGGDCGPPANNDVCRSGICFEDDNTCGLPTGESCTLASTCRELACSPAGQCGNCRDDSDCGAADSGMVCGSSDALCRPGCRGTGGNGCGAGEVCSSTTNAVGACYGCLVDADCGSADSGMVCNPSRECIAGCRQEEGNGCRPGAFCTSGDSAIGECFTVEGGGPGCSASGSNSPIGLIFWLALAMLAFFKSGWLLRIKQ